MIDLNYEAHRHAIKRLEESLKPVDERLHEWGRCTKNGPPRLGFADKASHLQPPQDQTMVPAPTFIPETVIAVDAAIARLTDIRQKVLAIAYLHFPGSPPDRQRGRLNMSRHKWEKLLRESRIIVGTMLGYEI